MHTSLACKSLNLFANELFWKAMMRQHFSFVRLYEGLPLRIGWKKAFIYHVEAYNDFVNTIPLPMDVLQYSNQTNNDLLIVLYAMQNGVSFSFYGCSRFGNDTHCEKEEIRMTLYDHVSPRVSELHVVDALCVSWSTGRAVRLPIFSISNKLDSEAVSPSQTPFLTFAPFGCVEIKASLSRRGDKRVFEIVFLKRGSKRMAVSKAHKLLSRLLL